MTTLTGTAIQATYGDVLTLTNSGQGMTSTLTNVQDGLGNSSPMRIATNKVNFDRTGGNQFQLDGIALTSTAAQINLSTKPNPQFQGTGGAAMPSGTTAQRDPGPINGEIRYNTDLGSLEAYQNNTWGGMAAESVLGPVSSIAGDISIFADTTGKLLSDSGVNIAAVAPPLLALGIGDPLTTDTQLSKVDILNFGTSTNDVGIIFRKADYVCGIFPNTIVDKPPNWVFGFANPSSTDAIVELTQGAFLLARLTQTQINALVPIDGMQVYNSTSEAFNFYQNGSWINFNNGAVLSVAGTANQITATGSSSVVLSIANNPVLPGTGGVTLPSGTTAQRPGSPNEGELRYNTDNAIAEGYINGSWVDFGSGFGSVTSITAGTNLTGGTITTSGTIALSATPTGLTSLGVGNLSLSANTIISGNSNGNISLVPNGTGLVVLGAAGVSVTSGGLLTTDTITTFDANVIATGGTPGLLSFYDANNSNFVAFKSGDTVPSNVIWTLPSADGSNLQGIITNGTGTLSFTTLANRNATFIVQTADASLPNAQSLIDLGAGLLKINASGVVQLAIPDTDYATEATLDSLVTEAEGFATTASTAAVSASASSGSAGTSAVAAAASAAAAAVSAVSAASDASSVSGAASAKFIIQTTDSHLPNAQSLGALTTGILLNTVTGSTGVLSKAVAGSDYYAPGLPLAGGIIFSLTETAISYAALVTDFTIGITDTSSARTISLPTAISGNKGQVYVVKDETGGANVNNITVNVTGGGNIDGAATAVISTSYGSLNFYSNGTQWFIW